MTLFFLQWACGHETLEGWSCSLALAVPAVLDARAAVSKSELSLKGLQWQWA